MIRLVAWFWVICTALIKLTIEHKYKLKDTDKDSTIALCINALWSLFTVYCCIIVALHLLELLSPILFGGVK